MSFFTALIAQETIKFQDKLGNFSTIGSLTIPDIVSGFIRLALVIAAIVFFFILVIGSDD